MDMNKVIKSILFELHFFLLQAVCLIWLHPIDSDT